MNNKSEDKIKIKENNKKTYTETLLSIIVLALIIAIFVIFFYKPNSIDFLQEIKDTFTYGMIIILGIISICIILFNIFIKEKKIK